MFDEFLSRVTALRSEDRPFAMAVVVSYQPPVSGKPGDKAIIESDGTVWGWIGGGCVQPLVVREALKAIEDGQPRLVRVAPSPSLGSDERAIHYTMTCHGGGALDIYIEPVLSKPQLVIVGCSAVAQSLCSLGKAIGYRVILVAAGASSERFPDADSILAELDLRCLPITRQTFLVVSTQGEQDEEALEQACQTDASYIAFVASETKARKLFELLAEKGISRDRLSQIRAPAGLHLGGMSPDEIGLSILAEIVQTTKSKTTAAGRERQAGDKLHRIEVKDPVCGMMVVPGEAKYISAYRGETYYFCCSGCKQEFDKQPEAYLKSVVPNL